MERLSHRGTDCEDGFGILCASAVGRSSRARGQSSSSSGPYTMYLCTAADQAKRYGVGINQLSQNAVFSLSDGAADVQICFF